MPRIALITAQFDQVRSGPGTFANYLSSSDHCPPELTFFSEDITAPTAYKRRVACPPWVDRVPGTAFFKAPIYHRAFLRVHRQQAFDLLWYNTSPLHGLISARRHVDLPVVLMINAPKFLMSRVPFASRPTLGLRRSITNSIKRPFEKRALHYCDAVVVNSEFMREQVSRQYGIPADKLYVLYKGVDVDNFPFRCPEPMSGPVRVLFMKRDHAVGGLADLIEALTTLPFDTRLTIAGPPLNRASAIEALIRRHRYEGAVDLRGRVPRDRVPLLFREHDLLCVPSHAEALGVAFLEALAAGLPAVGSNVGGIPEALDKGRAGWLAEPGNAADLRRTLIAAVRNPEQRLQKVHHGHSFVADHFSTKVMMRRFENIASSVIAAGNR